MMQLAINTSFFALMGRIHFAKAVDAVQVMMQWYSTPAGIGTKGSIKCFIGQALGLKTSGPCPERCHSDSLRVLTAMLR